MDRSGRAIVALLQRAAEMSNDEWDRVRTEADTLSHKLRAAEDRINQLETEVEEFQDRAVRAETWLQSMQREIKKTLIAPTATTRSKSRI
jgi:chromosome segregation ATPase